MSSYFDEHNCQPLRSGEAPDHLLHFSRLLLHGGYWRDIQMEFSELFGRETSPPASKECIENMKKYEIKEKDGECSVCLKVWTEGDKAMELPCSHAFHCTCIRPWLEKTNSCPMCRFELPTDDEDYEEMRRQKKRAKDREADLEVLHNSMFS